MRDELLGYYERELAFLRQSGAEFAQKYPKIAARLSLEPDKCEDPHVERMIEAVAFLASRVHLKLDDEFPEITEALLNVLYPHYLAPIPSMSIGQFIASEPGKLTAGYLVEPQTKLYSRPIQGTPCRFRTCYPVVVWPLEVTSAALESTSPLDLRGQWSEATLRISLRNVNETPLAELKLGSAERAPGIERLRFYLIGEPQLVYPLYEMIFNQATRLELRPHPIKQRATRVLAPTRALPKPPAPIWLTPDKLKPVGFEPAEGMLPYSARSFLGYRLLTDYFAFPEKFLLFDVTGLDQAARAGFGDEFDLIIHLRDVTPPRGLVDAGTFQLGCTPIINLFTEIAEPIQLTQQQHEYRVIPDVRRQLATEVYSVDSVVTLDPFTNETQEFQPFYSYRHPYGRAEQGSFWYATRRPSPRPEDLGTEVYLSLVDLAFNPKVPAAETITVRVTCTNRDLPGKLPFGGREGELEVEGAAPVSRVRCLRKPTNTLRPPRQRGAQWRLISHLTLNHLSLTDSHGSPAALREILLLYDFMESAATRKQIAGLARLDTRRVVRQTGSRIGTGFVRGLETMIEFDEEQYVGSGVFLFASVLERFLGLYASLNSFNQLVARTKQREGELKRWPPRAGDQILL